MGRHTPWLNMPRASTVKVNVEFGHCLREIFEKGNANFCAVGTNHRDCVSHGGDKPTLFSYYNTVVFTMGIVTESHFNYLLVMLIS